MGALPSERQILLINPSGGPDFVQSFFYDNRLRGSECTLRLVNVEDSRGRRADDQLHIRGQGSLAQNRKRA